MANARDFESPKYLEFRKKVFKRDGRKCQMPDCKSKHKNAYLQVHHIKRVADCPELEYEPRNGIVLCTYCHRRVTKHEEEFEEILYDVIRKKSATYFTMLSFKYGADKQEGDGDEPQA